MKVFVLLVLLTSFLFTAFALAEGSHIDNFQASDRVKAASAVEKAKEGNLDNAVKTAAQIDNAILRKNTMADIGNEDARQFWSQWGVGLIVNFATGHKKPINCKHS